MATKATATALKTYECLSRNRSHSPMSDTSRPAALQRDCVVTLTLRFHDPSSPVDGEVSVRTVNRRLTPSECCAPANGSGTIIGYASSSAKCTK